MLRTISGAAVSGFLGVVKRSLGGDGSFMTDCRIESGPGHLAFTTRIPGGIVEHRIDPGRSCQLHRRGFLCAS